MNELVIRNFRSIKHSAIPAAGLVFAHGDNGAGKSTIAGAIGTALVGRNRWTDKRGAGLARTIGQAGPEATISLDVRDKHITRRVHAAGSDMTVAGFAGNSTVQHKALLNHLKSTPEALAVASDVLAILEATPKEQADIIFGALAAKVGRADLLAHFVAAGLSAEEAEAVTVLAENGQTISQLGADEIERLHKLLFETRTSVKKELAGAAEQARSSASLRLVEPKKLEQLRQQLQQLSESLNEQNRRRARAEAAEEAKAELESVGGQAVDLQKLEQKIETAKERLADVREKARQAREQAATARAAVPPVPSKKPIAETPTAWHEVRDLADQSDDQVNKQELKISRALQPIKAINEKLRQLAQANGVLGFRQKFEAGRQQSREVAQQKKTREEALEVAKQATAVAEAAEQKFAESQAWLAEQMAKLAAAQKQQELMKQIGEHEPIDLEAVARQIEELEQQTSALRTQIAEAEAAERFRALKQKAESKVEQLTTQVKRLDLALDSLAPAARTALMDKKAGGLMQRLAESFKALTAGRYELAINMAPYEVLVRRAGEERALPLASLSASEQFRVAVLLQDAVASLGHAPFLVIDGADILGADEFGALMRYLETRVSHYQAIFVTATLREQDPRFQSVSQQWRTVLVDSGEAFALEAA